MVFLTHLCVPERDTMTGDFNPLFITDPRHSFLMGSMAGAFKNPNPQRKKRCIKT